MNLGTVWAEIRVKTDRFNADLATAMAQLKTADKTMSTTMKAWSAVGDSLSKVGKSLTTYVTLPLVALAGISTKFGLDFSRSIEYANTMLKLSGPELEKFRKGVLNISSTYGKAADDVGRAAYSISSVLHTSGEDTITILQEIAKGAKAGKISTEETGNAVIRMMSIYDIQAKDTASLVDTLSATVKAGNANWQDLANTLPQAAGAGKALGVNLTELSAVFAALSSKTGSAEEAGTAERAMLMSLIKPSDELKKAINDMGFATSQDAVAKLGLVGVLKELGKKYEGNADAIGKLFPNVRALSGATNLLSNGAKGLTDSLAMVQDSAGETSKQIAAGEGPADKFGDAMNRLKNSGIQLFTSLEPILEKFIDFINRTTKAFSELSPETQKALVTFGIMAATIGPVILIVGKLITAIINIQKAIPIIRALGAAVNAALGPIGWTIMAVVGAVALLATAWARDWGGIKTDTLKFVNWFKDTAVPTIIENIKKISFAELGRQIKNSFGTAEERLSDFNKEIEESNRKAQGSAQKLADKQTEIDEHRQATIKRINDAKTEMVKAAANTEINLAQQVANAESAYKQKSVRINEQLTSEQINDELEKLQAAQKQKERQAWLDSAKEKLSVEETEEEKAAIRRDIQSQLDAWQYEDTVDSYKKRQSILDKATQAEIEAQEKIAEAAKEAAELEAKYEQDAYNTIMRIEQEKADLRKDIQSNLAEYLRAIHERERDDAVKSLESERDSALDIIQDEIDARYKQYQADLDLIYKERDARLGAISKEISDLQEQHEKEERADWLAEERTRLAQAKTAEERARIQKEIDDRLADWAYQDKLESLRKEQDAVREDADKKAKVVEDAYKDDKDLLEQQLKDTQDLYAKKLEATKKYYDDLTLQRNLDAEAEKVLAENTMLDILKMLYGTKDQWAKLGSEIGDVFWSNLMSGITNLEELLKLLGKLPTVGHGGGGFQTFAEGGAVYGPTLALLGETATPSKPEIIIPPGASFGRMSVTYNIYGASDIATLRRELEIHDKELLNRMRGGR